MLNLRKKPRHTLPTPSAGIVGAAAIGLVVTGVLAYCAATRNREDRGLPFVVARRHRIHLQGAIHIDRSAKDIYTYWRDFSQLPKTMTFLENVEERGNDVSHWVAKGPLDSTLEWDSQIMDDLPNERISWHSLGGSDIRTWGDVEFRKNPHGQGTEVVVNFNFEPPGKIAGAAIGRFLKGLETAVLNQNLRNLKAYMETGEVPDSSVQEAKSA